MKPMKERKMSATAGRPDSSAYLPESPHKKNYEKVGQISQNGYPDTAPEVVSSQKKNIADANKGKAKPGHRH